MDENFKLSGDDTIRALRTIAQAPGELQWRLELVATLDRIRIQHEVSTKNILQNQKILQKSVAHITPTKIAELVNAQIEEHERKKDSAKYRSGWKTVRSHLLTAIVTILVGVVLYKLTGK